MAIPISIGDTVLGVLDVKADYINRFTDEDIAIKTTLAQQVATSLQNVQNFAQAQHQAERESMLNLIGQQIQSADSVEAVLQITARELSHALHSKDTRVILRDIASATPRQINS
jgi:GAF domain-containing protein